MKLHTEDKKFERGGTSAEAEFTIKTTAKAFDILSSGLYSDPILAVIRELSCNAHDSHVAAGNSEMPFRIHLPNTLEPFLSIRDFGTGLSDSDVLNIYTTYFESTKTDSNDYIGALGLGSKSPFSYTSAFEVSSYFNGMKAMYSIFLNESGIPSIARMGETPTDELNGLEIKITVESKDFYTFKERTADVLKYFPTKPEVVGYPGFTFNSLPSQSISGAGWFVAPKQWSNQRFTAVQGNVPYRVDMGKISEMLTESERDFFEHAQIVAYFNIGDLEVAASREEIRYDARSKQALVEKAREIRADLTAALERDIAKLNVKELWTAYIQLDAYSQETFGNKNSLSKFVTADKITNPFLMSYVNDDRRVMQLRGEDFEHWNFVLYGRTRGQVILMSKLSVLPNELHPSNDIKFVLVDTRKGGIKRIVNWGGSVKAQMLIVIRPNDHKVTSAAKTRELNEIIKSYGMPPVMKVTSMDEVGTYSTQKLTTFFQAASPRYVGNTCRYRWKAVSETPTSGLYFFFASGKTPYFGETTSSGKCARAPMFSPSQFNKGITKLVKMINFAQGTEYTPSDVYGVPVCTMRKLKKNKNWVNIFDLAVKSLNHFEAEAELVARWEATPDELGIKQLISANSIVFSNHVRGLDEDSAFRSLVMPLITAQERTNDTELMQLAGIAAEFDRDVHQNGDNIFGRSCESYFDLGAFNVYPMLRKIQNLAYNNDKEHLDIIFDYIKLVDRS